MQLRSIELQVPDRQTAVNFLKDPWGLLEVDQRNQTTYLRGTGAQHYLISITDGADNKVLSTTFTGTRKEIESIWSRVRESGLSHGPWTDLFDEPGQGAGFVVAGYHGEPYRFLVEAESPPPPLPVDSERPIQLAHVVFDAPDRETASRTLEEVFGFKVSDRTARITFVRCNELHHVIAFSVAESNRTLNHVAFEMRDTDAVLRGMGRLREAGCATVWGPGRHGPGNNVFAYFVGPFGACIEYTAEVQRVDDSYPTGTPESWKWPAGRIDHWGIFTRDLDQLTASASSFPYATVEKSERCG
jgi:catechol 2,3-dioxygenase-like lactoylglutathione lyase family enzyme